MRWRPPMPHSMRFAIRSWAKQFVAPRAIVLNSTTDDLLDEVPVAPDRRMIFMRCGYCGHVHFFDRELVEDRIRWIKENRLS